MWGILVGFLLQVIVKLVARYADWVIKYPKTIWVIVLVISLLALWPNFLAKPKAAHIPLQDFELTTEVTGTQTFRPDRADSFLVIQAPELFTPGSIAAIRRLMVISLSVAVFKA